MVLALGISTDPSSSWLFSITATKQRPTARPEPFKVDIN